MRARLVRLRAAFSRRMAAALSLALSVVACESPIDVPTARVAAPGDGAVFETGVAICFRASPEASGYRWLSSAQGEIGRGATALVALREGSHLVSLWRDGACLDSIRVEAVEPAWTPGGERVRSLNQGAYSLILPAGSYSPFAVSRSPSGYALFSCGVVSGDSRAPTSPPGREPVARDRNPRFLPGYGPESREYARARVLSTKRNGAVPGATRSFRMADCARGNGVPGYEVEATLARTDGAFELWIDDETPVPDSDIEALWERAAGISLVKARAIWGEPVPPEGAGPVVLLASGKLNAAGLAIGFFNPADFWPYDGDEASASYNPASNDGSMVLYLAIPDAAVPSYSLDSIAATACHEYQHLVAFSRTTWLEWTRGNPSPPFVETWLAEAQAHLTESLCGFGESGGNYDFFRRYADEPWSYSIGSTDADGSSDSAGKRGGAAAFLWWLYRREELARAGGGPAFLRSLVESKAWSWDEVGAVAGTSTDTLLREWAAEVASRPPGYRSMPIYDETTGQRVDLGFFAGLVGSMYGASVDIDGPTRIAMSDVTIAPRSIIWFEAVSLATRSSADIVCARGDGRAIIVFAMR